MSDKQLKQAVHDQAVSKIAELLFTFPGQEFTPAVFHPSWVTYTNAPEHKMPVPHHWAGELYPDIVVVDSARSNVPVIIGEVETKDTLFLEEAFQLKWKPDKDECSVLYVFVPAGTARDVANLILDYKFCFPTAMYTYDLDDKGNLKLTPV